jgi:putative FmdB family regulatory protein
VIYSYKCSKCNSELTIERSIHEEVRSPTCFDCHESMNRVWDSPAITFKGTGFYSTDKQ